MIVLATSTVCRRSQSTRYGDSGVLFAVSRGIHCASHSALSVAISLVTAVPRPALQAILHLDQQRRQRQRRVAGQHLLGAHVLVEVGRVERGVDDLLAL